MSERRSTFVEFCRFDRQRGRFSGFFNILTFEDCSFVYVSSMMNIWTVPNCCKFYIQYNCNKTVDFYALILNCEIVYVMGKNVRNILNTRYV